MAKRPPSLPDSTAEVRRLVLAYPLAWVVSGGGEAFEATPLPLLPVFGPDGCVTHLIGHFARANRQVAALEQSPRAMILFRGPDSYISPSWLADRTQAPTWNYAAARFVVDIAFTQDASETLAVLRELVGAMERGRPNAWRIEDMGERYTLLTSRIIAFSARVLEIRPAFKLGERDRPDISADMLAALGRDDPTDLRPWMERARAAAGRKSD